jgi:hypothetical protein
MAFAPRCLHPSPVKSVFSRMGIVYGVPDSQSHFDRGVDFSRIVYHLLCFPSRYAAGFTLLISFPLICVLPGVLRAGVAGIKP